MDEIDMEETVTLSLEELRYIFEVWDQRYRKDPEKYTNIVDHLLRGNPYEYGLSASLYLRELAREIYDK